METLLTTNFDEHCLTRTRHDLLGKAHEQGMVGERLMDFLVAVNECVVNAVEHGGGRGRLNLWREDGHLLCEIKDSGPGISAQALIQVRLPPSASPGGRGIWLMRRLTDSAVFTASPDGTTVRMSMRLPQPSKDDLEGGHR
ncbi:ATP-binding protein [Nonomuraea sp. NPDC051941]|uniref:ATP-binding protein n=1 Tax=Nonomuraea sp. NPDC051941 TaxID=3364373 RepID=UPI0037CB91F8